MLKYKEFLEKAENEANSKEAMAKKNDLEEEEKELDHTAPNTVVAPESMAEKAEVAAIKSRTIRVVISLTMPLQRT